MHWHPDDAFAAEHLGARYGKSEAWLVLSAEGGARARVGFREDVDEQTLRDWFEQQDVDAMLAALNDVEAAPGDCIYVPAGIPHAIDEGIFMIEVQEPSDLGVMLEWRGFGFDPDAATIGLGPDVALRSARREAVSRGELADWTRRSGEAPQLRDGAAAVVPPDAERFFRAEWLRPDPGTTLEPAWSVLVAVAGAGRLSTEGGELDVAAGDTVLVPYAAGTGELLGEVEAVRCLPPRSEEAS